MNAILWDLSLISVKGEEFWNHSSVTDFGFVNVWSECNYNVAWLWCVLIKTESEWVTGVPCDYRQAIC